jgi:hypothetical protein
MEKSNCQDPSFADSVLQYQIKTLLGNLISVLVLSNQFYVGFFRSTVLTERAAASFYWGEQKIVYLTFNGYSVT